ncbi:hypothetical protein BDY17DRAFT_35638 [Neohortaea acidophila]|uniref:Fork-head domain-containing protein n=1 Tax=Neohortaea acidophila TaxID=245834 RepID=A0A6A6PJR2_9PEZI|nr:uncharacterized protein BDY17DRAFT_35638 [Neohortaea acidophila]KAF2480290.1 hypothetical protein BDY17DRAFT_35638 [Neohortaea acidophila]
MGASTTIGTEASKHAQTKHDAEVSGSSDPTLLKWAREANASDMTTPSGTRHTARMGRSHEDIGYDGRPSLSSSTLASRQRPISPPNLRQTFRADRRDDWSSPRNRTSNSPGSSPDDIWSRRRGGRWEPPPRRWSPVDTASPRRASFGRRASPPRNQTSVSPLHFSTSGPENAIRRESSNGDGAESGLFQNKKWIAPHLHSGPRHSVKQPARPLGARSPVVDETLPVHTVRNMEWGGIKGVPTGPKAAPHVVPASGLTAAKISPHIFIPWRSLPAKRGMIKHLHGFLRPHTRKESNIHLDEDGWYICLGDSEASRHTLKECYDAKNGAKMFSTYTLEMHYYPHGQPAARRLRPLPSEEDVPGTGTRPDRIETSPQVSRLEKSVLHQPPQSINGKTTDQQSAPAAEASIDIPLDSAAVPARQSSPLRVPSRQDRDDALSCISGFTGSDVSSSRRLKCHVCQKGTNIDVEPLVCCSSCPRRYHRRCHDRPPIPFQLDEDHTWRCRRCIRKDGITSGTRLTRSSPVLKRSREKAGMSSEERPTKMMRLESPFQPVVSLDLNSLTNSAKAPTPNNEREQISALDVADTNAEQPPDNLSNKREQSPALDVTDSSSEYSPPDNIGLTEAIDLVAKSFDLPRPHGHSHSPRPSQPLKLRLVRKKIVDAASPAHDSSHFVGIPGSPLAHTSIAQTSSGTGVAPVSGQSNGDDAAGKDESCSSTHGGNTDTSPNLFVSNRANGNGDVEMTDATTQRAAATVVEIPESPDEQRTQDRDEQVTSKDMVKSKISHTKVATQEPGPTGIAHVDTAQSRSNTSQGQIPKAKMKRIRPGAPSFAKCVRCGKTTSSGPSGSNKLCSRCKSDGVARQASGSPQINTVQRTERPPSSSPGLHQSARTDKGTGEPVVPLTMMPDSGVNPARTAERLSIETTAPVAISAPTVTSPVTPIPALTVATETIAAPVSRSGDLDTAANPPQREEETTNDDLSSPPESNDVDSSSDSESERDVGHPTSNENEESPAIKRRTQTRPANHEHDLGDSYTRPKGAYEKLIGMALCAAPNHRLKATDITAWVVKNIPGYKHGEGKWENSLRATLTLKREGYELGKPGLWRKVEVGLKLNEACLWELLPGQAEKLVRWDPVLKQPVSPPKVWLKIPSVRRTEEVTTGKQKKSPPNIATPVRSAAAKVEASSSKKRRRRRSTLSDAEPLAAETTSQPLPKRSIKTQTVVIDDSSDEEPLLTQERRRSYQLQPLKEVLPAAALEDAVAEMMDVDENVPTPDVMDVDASEPAALPLTHGHPPPPPAEERAVELVASPLQPARARNSETRPALSQRTNLPMIEKMVEMTEMNTNFNAKDLFGEWPELKSLDFDRSAKIAEIKQRPTRKERFGRQTPLAEFELVEENKAIGKANERRATNENTASEATLATLYPWENTEGVLVQCNSLQELFNLPNNPMAIIHDGNLAYRDGTRGVDGSLPRAKAIYKTDYYTR